MKYITFDIPKITVGLGALEAEFKSETKQNSQFRFSATMWIEHKFIGEN